jgi:hypothetical protein
MDYSDVHIRIGQELREVYKYANERDINSALERALELRELARELVYALSNVKQS